MQVILGNLKMVPIPLFIYKMNFCGSPTFVLVFFLLSHIEQVLKWIQIYIYWNIRQKN